MGKAQSKRSVDITTDPKKAGDGDEVAGKVEKIEDIDQKEAGSSTAAAVNGDATSQEKGESSEKKETEESETDKDLTTEKTAEAAAGGAAAEGGSGGRNAAANSPDSHKEEQKEGGSGTSGAEEISPLAEESMKSKSKKDKMKKKWSFRSISFGKKDKQKPAKSEEATTTPESGVAPVTNGEDEKTEESAKKDEGASGDASTVGAVADSTNTTTSTETKTTENGDSSVQEQQLNGDKTPSPTTEEQPKQNETNESAAAAAATATETTPAAAAAVAPVSSNNDDTAKENVTEVAVTTTATTVENVVAASVEAAAAATPVTNGNAAAEEVAATTNNTEESNNKASIPAVNDVDVVEKPHQNGTNGDDHQAEAADSVQIPADAEQIKNKSQIEVNTISADLILTNLNEVVVAAELDQTQSQNIKTTTTSTPSELLSHVDDDNDVVATVQSFDNVPSSNEISEEEQEVVASIIAAVSETPKTADVDTDTINLPTATNNIMTTSIDNEVQVPQPQQLEQEQEQLSGEGVFISNVEKPDTEPSLPPPPLPVSQPPSQVSVFAFKDSTETTTTTTTTTNNNETAMTTTTTNDMEETTGSPTGPAPANDEQHNSALSEVSSSSLTKEETQNEDHEQTRPEPESDSIAVVHPTITLLLEEDATTTNKDEAFEIIDMVPPKKHTVTTESPEKEKLSVRFSLKVTINEAIETDEIAADTTDDEELQKVKSEAEQFVADVTEKAAEFVMQKQNNKTDENTEESIVEGVTEETQRLPSPPPPLETANYDDADDDVNDKNEEVATLSENDHHQKEEMEKKDHDSNAVTFVESKMKEEQQELEEEKCLAELVEIPEEESSVLKNTQNDTTDNDEINFDIAASVVVADVVDSSIDHHSNGRGDAGNNTAAEADHIAAADEKIEVPMMMELEIDPLVKGTIEIEEAAPTAQQSSYKLEDDSSNKDNIASAKDLKENVAAEIKTQDLPVTCE